MASALLVTACSSVEPEWKGVTNDRSSVSEGGELHGIDQGPEQSNEDMRNARMSDDREAFPREIEAIQKLMKTAEQIRELAFTHDITIRVQSKDGIRAYLQRKMQSDKIHRTYARHMALDLLPPGTTFDKLVEEASKAPVLGYYEPEEKYLVLRDDVAYGLTGVGGAMANIEWRGVIVHELVHALQDQHFGLAGAMNANRTTDEDHAFMSLVEGDATLAELQYIIGRFGVGFRTFVQDLYAFDRMLNGMPSYSMRGAMSTPIAQQPGVFRYRSGAVFAAGVWREQGTTGLNRAFRKQPKCADEIMDPLLYLGGFKRDSYRLPSLTPMLRAGYKLSHEDSLGRVELGAYLQKSGLGGDTRAATLLGDRIAVFERDGSFSAVWLIKMSSVDDARAIAERAVDFGRDSSGKPNPRIGAFRHIDFTIVMSNVDPKVQADLKKQLTDWIDNDGVLGKR